MLQVATQTSSWKICDSNDTQIDVGENNEKAISYAMTLMDLNLI